MNRAWIEDGGEGLIRIHYGEDPRADETRDLEWFIVDRQVATEIRDSLNEILGEES